MSVEDNHVLNTVRMVMTSGWHIAFQEKYPARLDRCWQRDANGVQRDRRPNEGLWRFAEVHSQALDGRRKRLLAHKPFDRGVQLFKVAPVHLPLSSAPRADVKLFRR